MRWAPTDWCASTSTAGGAAPRGAPGSPGWGRGRGGWGKAGRPAPPAGGSPSGPRRGGGGLECVGRPVASLVDLAFGPGKVTVPIAADESIRRAADPCRVRELEAADIAVLKVQPLGGVRACLRIAEDIGLPVVVSSA